MVVGVTVLIDGRDYSEWVESVSVKQSKRTYYRTFSVVLRGAYDSIGTDSIVDITYMGVPQIVDGIVSPDAPPTILMDHDPQADSLRVPSLLINGFDWAWKAQRKVPARTLVLAPNRHMARVLVESSRSVVGRWQFVQAHNTEVAVRALGRLAGLRVEYLLPSFTIPPTILDPRATLWDGIQNLVKALSPEFLWRRERKALLIADAKALRMAGMGTVNLAASAIVRAEVRAFPRARVRRIILVTPDFP